jgi:GNAT superfamily N-acetyltransferase
VPLRPNQLSSNSYTLPFCRRLAVPNREPDRVHGQFFGFPDTARERFSSALVQSEVCGLCTIDGWGSPCSSNTITLPSHRWRGVGVLFFRHVEQLRRTSCGALAGVKEWRCARWRESRNGIGIISAPALKIFRAHPLLNFYGHMNILLFGFTG